MIFLNKFFKRNNGLINHEDMQTNIAPWFEWNINKGILTIYGNGPLPEYEKDEIRPWDSNLDLINEVVIEKGITSSGVYTFTRMPNLKKIIFGPDCVLIRLCTDVMPKMVEIKAKNTMFYYCRFVKYNSKEYPSKTTAHIREKMKETYSYIIRNFFKKYPKLIERYLMAAEKDIYGWNGFMEIIYKALKEKVYINNFYTPELFWNSESLEKFLDKCLNHKWTHTTMQDDDFCVYYQGQNEETNGTMHHEDILALGVLLAKNNLLNLKGRVRTNIRPWPAMLESFYKEVYGCEFELDYTIPTGDKELDEAKSNHPPIVLVSHLPQEYARLDYINGTYKLFVQSATDRFNAGSCYVEIAHLIKDNKVYVTDLMSVLVRNFGFSGYGVDLPNEYIEI